MSPAAALEPGADLDGFRLGERLHSGATAVLHAASREGSPFPLLVKLPRLGHGEPATNVISHEMEALLLRVLRGPHVPRFVAAGDLARRPYLVMERIDGRPLSSLLGRAPLPPDEVARLGAAVAAALHDLHLQEVVHLDVKPSNVLLRDDGRAVLVDFGIARHAHYPDLLAEEVRDPVGSAPYISPEQIQGIRSDPRSDVFALGVVLYELATGALPFGWPRSRAGLRRRLHRDPLPPRAVAPGVPEWLQEIILRCVEPDPADRYATAAQLAFDLAHPAGVPVTARGRRLRRAGLGTVLRRWLSPPAARPGDEAPPSARVARAPIVLVAVATQRPDAAREEALREGVRRVVSGAGDVRLACVTVIPPTPALGGASDAETTARRRIEHLVRLRHWAEPLALAPGRLSAHVLEAADAAEALLDYARANRVDHVVIGAPPAALPAVARGTTVALQVVAAAPCSVTLVRPPRE